MTCLGLVTHPRFEGVIHGVIAVNAVVVAVELSVDGHEHLLDTASHAILAIYVVELGMRAIAHRRGFARQPWCLFDALIVALSLLPFAGEGLMLARLARLTRLLHLTRIVQQLRLVHLFRTTPLKEI